MRVTGDDCVHPLGRRQMICAKQWRKWPSELLLWTFQQNTCEVTLRVVLFHSIRTRECVCEVVRRIIGKALLRIMSRNIQETVGSRQLCAGQPAGVEAAIRAMQRIYESAMKLKHFC